MIHLGAHAVDVSRLYATQRILGVITVFWSIFAGLFLTLGGARKLTTPAWGPLLDVVSASTLHTMPAQHAYLLVGAGLIIVGCIGLVGLRLTKRWFSVASGGLGAAWCFATAGFLGFSNVAVADGGNFLSLSLFLNAALFGSRVFLLSKEPAPGRAVQMYEQG
ncbi:hypothetical protein AB0K45_09485 [Micrococcus luteus]|uniref:hypothetical protein n=1 Tax=Micrococcus luteus TaxID=1270 RepID=UPI0034171C22